MSLQRASERAIMVRGSNKIQMMIFSLSLYLVHLLSGSARFIVQCDCASVCVDLASFRCSLSWYMIYPRSISSRSHSYIFLWHFIHSKIRWIFVLVLLKPIKCAQCHWWFFYSIWLESHFAVFIWFAENCLGGIARIASWLSPNIPQHLLNFSSSLGGIVDFLWTTTPQRIIAFLSVAMY